MIVYVSARAEAELEAAFEFINVGSPRAALKVRSAVTKAIFSLVDLPSRGRPSMIEGSRELIVPGTPYVIVYRVEADSVRVLRIRHTSQDPSP